MISHAKISRHRRMFKMLTGLSTEGSKQILLSFEEAWEADLDRRDAGAFVSGAGVEAARGGAGVRRQTRVHPGLFPALPHRGMAQGGMNPETETEKLLADSRAYLR